MKRLLAVLPFIILSVYFTLGNNQKTNRNGRRK